MKGTANALRALVSGEEGADSTEYALLAALVALGLIGGASFLGQRLNGAINAVGSRVPVLP